MLVSKNVLGQARSVQKQYRFHLNQNKTKLLLLNIKKDCRAVFELSPRGTPTEAVLVKASLRNEVANVLHQEKSQDTVGPDHTPITFSSDHNA